MFVTEGGTVASKGVLPNLGGDVSRDVILEYARAVSPRYLTAGRQEKGVILDEFCKTTGHLLLDRHEDQGTLVFDIRKVE